MVNKVYIKENQLFKLINDQSIVITENKMLCNNLIHSYIKHNNNIVCFKEIFYFFYDFIKKLYCLTKIIKPNFPYLISHKEQQLLFFNIKNSNGVVKDINEIDAILQNYKYIQEYNIEINNLTEFKKNLFYLKHYLNELNNNNYIDIIQFIKYLSSNRSLLKQLNLKMNIKKILLIGYQDINPLMKNFIQSYKDSNIKINFFTIISQQNSQNIEIIKYNEKETAIKTVAQKVFNLYRNNNNIKIGIMIPNFNKNNDCISEIFNDIFLDEDIHHVLLLDNKYRKYSFSLGKSLFNIPIIQQLLLWIKYDEIKKFSEIALMFTSSYIKGYKQFSILRKQLIFKIKKYVPYRIYIKDLYKYHLYKEYDIHLKNFVTKIHNLNEKYTQNKVTANGFVYWINKIIEIIGYVNESNVSYLEYIALSRFYSILNMFLNFERFKKKMYIHNWITLLIHFTIQEQIKENIKNIQLLDIKESYDMIFDHIFIIDMTENNSKNIINNFVLSETFINKILKQGDNIEISYSEYLSHCFKHIKKPPITIKPIYHTKIINKIHYRDFFDNNFPQFTEENYHINGGTNFFKNIYECPYRSILIHRLYIAGDESHEEMFSKKKKGIIIHNILEQIWKELKTLSNLKKLKEHEVLNLIKKTVYQVFNNQVIDYLPNLIKQLETNSIISLIYKWLHYEKKYRATFKIIELEKYRFMTIKNIIFKIRIDRIDEINNGDRLIIDYKTSYKKNHINLSYHDASKFKVQMPIYSLYENSHGIAIANIHHYDLGLKNILYNFEIKNILKNSNIKHFHEKEFNKLKLEWKQNIEKKIMLFKKADMTITPSLTNCKYCLFYIMCRVNL